LTPEDTAARSPELDAGLSVSPPPSTEEFASEPIPLRPIDGGEPVADTTEGTTSESDGAVANDAISTPTTNGAAGDVASDAEPVAEATVVEAAPAVRSTRSTRSTSGRRTRRAPEATAAASETVASSTDTAEPSGDAEADTARTPRRRRTRRPTRSGSESGGDAVTSETGT
jgi:hypothetical protein